MQSFTFTLPVKRHIKKYLQALYGESVLISLQTDIGFVVLNVLGSRIEHFICKGHIDLFINRYDSEVTFTMPYYYLCVTKSEISPKTCTLLNRYIETKFEDELCRYVDFIHQNGMTRKAGIEKFAQLYNIDIEIDISFDSLIKMEYRWRKKNIEKSFSRLSDENTLFPKAVA